MDKKIGIVTIIDNNNYGNRLQNYALNYYCKNKLNTNTLTLINKEFTNNKKNIILKIIRKMLSVLKNKVKTISDNNKNNNRKKYFVKFNGNITYYKRAINAYTNLNKFDYLIVGSDQVWNPNFSRLSDIDVLKNVDPSKRISYAASFGINNIPTQYQSQIINEIAKFKAISVREDRAKEIIEELTDRKDVQVLIDPTMLLTKEEWSNVASKPKQLDSKKYILNYFLGELSEEKSNEIKRIAKENECEIINILDKNSQFYETGPAEFLYLEKNAFLICTDSFHSSVFAILFDRPFIIFDREEKNVANMNSRLDTLISKFKLTNRKYNGKNITKENLEHDYTEAYKILEKEREKSKEFLEKALDIK